MKRFAWWGNIILVSVLTLVLAGPVWGGGMPSSRSPAFTDYGSFLGEYRSAGALAFYYNSESVLRLAKFEEALMRYRFLKGQIQRKRRDYYGLLDMVDLRLKFLKKQMHLTNRDIAAIPPRWERIPQKKPPKAKTPPKKEAAAKPKPPGTKVHNRYGIKAGLPLPGQMPPVVVIPGRPVKAGAPPRTVTTPKTATPPGTAASPVTITLPRTPTTPGVAASPQEVVTTDTPKAKDEKAEEDKEEKKPPPPPLSFWDKLKIRLHLKKPPTESGS